MRLSSVSYSTSTVFAHIRRRNWRSSTSSKDGTTFTVGIPRWAIDRRRPSSGKPPHDFPISNYRRKPGNFNEFPFEPCYDDFNAFAYPAGGRQLWSLNVRYAFGESVSLVSR